MVKFTIKLKKEHFLFQILTLNSENVATPMSYALVRIPQDIDFGRGFAADAQSLGVVEICLFSNLHLYFLTVALVKDRWEFGSVRSTRKWRKGTRGL